MYFKIATMFNLGFFELIVIVIVGLIVLGPEKFPKAARQVVKLINEIKRAFLDIKSGFDDIQLETQKILEAVKKETNLDIKSGFDIQLETQKILEAVKKETNLDIKSGFDNIQKKAQTILKEVEKETDKEPSINNTKEEKKHHE